MHEGNFKEKSLFCKLLKLNTRAENVLEAVNDFFKENGLDWGNLVGITTDGVSTMLGLQSGFQTLVKQCAPLAIGVALFQGPTKHRKELQGTTRNYKVLLNLQNA